MKKTVATIILLLTLNVLFGQALDTEWEQFEEPREIVSDDHVFHSPVWHAPDPFRRLARYRFNAVRYRERGLDDRFRRVSVGGIDLSDNISPHPDYVLTSFLWKTSYRRGLTPAMVPGENHAGGLGYSENYSPKLSLIADGLSVSVRAADRGYRAGVDIDGKTGLEDGWHFNYAMSIRMGPDGHIPGVRSNSSGVTLALTKEWTSGHSLTLTYIENHSLNGLRASATGEAFELTGDRLYNPSWGWQDGLVRNSRERQNSRYLALAMFETRLGEKRKLTVTAAFRWGRDGYSALAWYNTHSPMPDYYRKMPSYFPDWDAKDEVAEAWRAQDPAITQVDWTELYYANTLEGGHSTYILEERIEQLRNAAANIGIERRIGNDLTLSYGLYLRRDRTRRFKEAADMLGGEYVYNIDQYATDYDGEYRVGAGNDNDLRNPGREVRRGDRFGYDYALTRFDPALFGIVRWDKDGYGITAAASLRQTWLTRRGFYEKELFPGTESFGKSAVAAFTTYSINAAAYWNVSVKHKLSVAALASSRPPMADDIFISPAQNNFMPGAPLHVGIYGAEASWAFSGKNVDLRVTGFVNASTDETEIRQYYDDLEAVFSNMMVSGIDKLGYGIEAGVEARFTRWLSLTAGASLADYRYNSEPVADIFADMDNSTVSQGVVCYMSGLKTGPPQTVAAVELTYSDRRRWRVSLSAEYMGDRYVAVNPLYHSARITGINRAPEIMRRFTDQERLPDAFTLGLSVSKGFVLKRGYLRLAASARNLLGTGIIYSGYEQMRILRSGSGINRTLVPFPSKYLWGYPMTWNFTVSYRI